MMLVLLAAAALRYAADGDAAVQTWTVQCNSARTSVSLDTKYEERTPRGNSLDEESHEVALADLGSKLPGLTKDQVFAHAAHVHFRRVHDAGTLEYDGLIHDGSGGGDFQIVFNPRFATELQRRGIGTPSAVQQRRLTLLGADYSYLDLLTRYDFELPNVGQLLDLLEHGVSADYLRGMAALRLTPHSIDGIVRARDHGVTPEYARSLLDAGYRSLSLDDLVRARDHGVSADLVAAFKSQGYVGIPMDQMVRLEDHGVSADFIRGIKALGYAPSAEDLIRLRDHGVTPQYVAGLRRRGYNNKLSISDLIKLRDSGI